MRSFFRLTTDDDEALFAFYSMVRHRAHVVVVLRSQKQELSQGGPTSAVRERETDRVVSALLGLTYEQWSYPDVEQDWAAIEKTIVATIAGYDTVIAPAVEIGGHEDHNEIGAIVAGQNPRGLISYLTYQRGYGRSTNGRVVKPTDEERLLKKMAIGCYLSQSGHPETAPWFPGGEYWTTDEWVL